MEAIFILSAYNFCMGLLSSLSLMTAETSCGLAPEALVQEKAAVTAIADRVNVIGNRTIYKANTADEDLSETDVPDDDDEYYEEEVTDSEYPDVSSEYDDYYAPDAVYCFSSDFDSSFKAYMDYRCITDTGSVQYQLQQEAYTDDRGFRRIGDDYCVALGTGLTSGCGERFLITLDSGCSFTAIVSDVKADIHTDSTNCYAPRGYNAGNIVEFIIDTDSADSDMLCTGSADCFYDLSGNVISIQAI